MFNSDTYVVGQFATGSIRHQLVTGISLTRQESGFSGFSGQAAPIDLFNPVYGQPLGDVTFEYNIPGSMTHWAFTCKTRSPWLKI
ncbi:MAG: hypothetical protein V7K89_29915 [Nostoc sp.]|uniref:hypothetical protein n=1 Tax=Nostoc sp. TaxID=1180 RepID=UPI002FFBADF4